METPSINTSTQVQEAMSLILLSRGTVAAMEEPDLYPVEDGLRMALDKLQQCYEYLNVNTGGKALRRNGLMEGKTQ